MNAEQKLKHYILLKALPDEHPLLAEEITADNIDDVYDEALEADDSITETMYEVREGEEETSLPCPYSRHYESKSVAAKMPDGTWIGWTHWYGGGKHGCPEEIDWMEHAYPLDCKEEEKLVVVRTFSVIKEQGPAA